MDDEVTGTGDCEFDRRSGGRGLHQRCSSFDDHALRWLHHLQSGCPRCREALIRTGAEDRPPDFERLADLFRTLSVEAIGHQLADPRVVARFVARLESLSRPHQDLVVSNCPPNLLEIVSRQLLERARSTRFRSAAATVRWAELALLAARRIADKRRIPLEIETLGELGNARRIGNDYVGAEAALSEAARLLAEARVTLDVELEIRGLRIALDIDRRRLVRAERALHRLWRVCRAVGAERETLFAELRLGIVHALKKEPDRAMSFDARVIRGAEAIGDRHLKLLAINNLLQDGLDLQEPEVGEWISSARPLFRERAAPLVQARFDWAYARWLVLDGKFRDGLKQYSLVAERYRGENQDLIAARLDIEMSAILRRVGRSLDAKRSADRALEVFEHYGLEADRRQALAYLS